MISYFANISEDNIVLNVIVIPSENSDQGQEFINEELGLQGTWIETDIYSRYGIKYQEDGITPTDGPPLRYTYATVGYIYDPELDVFYPPQPIENPSWIFNPEKMIWVPPIPMPETGGPWLWNEELVDWEKVVPEDE